jgi:hypothetical protein
MDNSEYTYSFLRALKDKRWYFARRTHLLHVEYQVHENLAMLFNRN